MPFCDQKTGISLLFKCRFVARRQGFHCCLSVVLWPEEGDFPETVHRVVYVTINKRSFEYFVCLDLILEC